VAAESLQAIDRFRWPVERLSRLIDEHQFDLYNDPMPTMAALEGYLSDTSSVLFSLAAATMGPSSSEVEHLSRHAGLAQGIVQLMASLPLDASQRRLYVPQQVLTSHGCDIEDIFAGKQTPPLRQALNDVLENACAHLDAAYTLLASVAPNVRPAFLFLAHVRRDLAVLMRADNDPFVVRPASRLATLWTLWRASRSRVFVG
jgi:15-cis-phytoene synthase